MDRRPFIRPSAAAIWKVCQGYAAMRAAYPEQPEELDTDIREDGIACHWLAAEIWDGRTPMVDSLSPNHRLLDEDMFYAVDMYHDVLRSWPNVVPVCEKSVPIDGILIGMTGTPDAWAYNPTTKRLYIADLKYGFRFVEVWDNWQLICYACALMALLGLNYDETIVEFVIVQPRSFHRDGFIRKWVVRAADLRAPIEELRVAANAAANAIPVCTPNPGCLDCPARHACVALQNAVLTACENSYAGIPLELTPAALGNELRIITRAIKLMEARKTGLETQADSLIRKGVRIPWFQLTATYARERWREGTEHLVLTLAQYFKVDLRKPVRAVTPAQARKLLPANVVAMFAEKPSTGVRLTPQDPNDARKAFQQPVE